MDNKGNQNKNGKNPRGQNYAVLIMTMLFTLLCVAMMHNLWQGSRTHKMPYSEFNQMLKDHEVESVVIGNGKIQITPKEDSKKYGGSQGKYGNLVGMEYYTIPINDPDLEKKLDEAGVLPYIYRRSSIQVAELKVDRNGIMGSDRNAPFDFYLPDGLN